MLHTVHAELYVKPSALHVADVQGTAYLLSVAVVIATSRVRCDLCGHVFCATAAPVPACCRGALWQPQSDCSAWWLP